MNRYEIYHLLKEILCKHGAIPMSEEQYLELCLELINLVDGKALDYR